jgi:hypothetical protein
LIAACVLLVLPALMGGALVACGLRAAGLRWTWTPLFGVRCARRSHSLLATTFAASLSSLLDDELLLRVRQGRVPVDAVVADEGVRELVNQRRRLTADVRIGRTMPTR